MDRRATLAACCAVAAGATGCVEVPPLPTERVGPPNVLVIIADDMGVDKLGSYAADADPDYAAEASYLPDTPVLDEMASAGVRFTDAWANPTCSPARAALLSGRYGFRTGVGQPVGQDGARELEPDEVTLAEVAVEAGYATGLFGKWHVGENEPPASWDAKETWDDYVGETLPHEINPITQGWQRFVGTLEGTLEEGYTDWLALESECVDCRIPEVTVRRRFKHATIATVDDALEWIGEQDGPWLATVMLHAPHSPWEIPPTTCNYRDPERIAPTTESGIYEEMIECMDLRIGDLIDGVHALGDLDDTFVIFAADNGTGPELTEEPFYDERGKGTIYESGIRVPLIVADGKELVARQADHEPDLDWRISSDVVRFPGAVNSAPVNLLDIYATVADVIGADKSSAVDSVSLLPMLLGREGARREMVYSEMFGQSYTGYAATRVDDWKLIVEVDVGEEGTCIKRRKLYSLGVDRFESTNLVNDFPVIVETLSAAMDALGADSEGYWLDIDDC